MWNHKRSNGEYFSKIFFYYVRYRTYYDTIIFSTTTILYSIYLNTYICKLKFIMNFSQITYLFTLCSISALCKMFFSFDLQAIGHFGVWWDTLAWYIIWMGESQGGVSPSEALTFHWLHLSGLMVGYFGGRSGGWVIGGR